jgi:hypothetical protein
MSTVIDVVPRRLLSVGWAVADMVLTAIAQAVWAIESVVELRVQADGCVVRAGCVGGRGSYEGGTEGEGESSGPGQTKLFTSDGTSSADLIGLALE